MAKDLLAATDRAKKRIEEGKGNKNFSQTIHSLLNYMENKSKANKSTFAIPVGGEVFFVEEDEVIYFEADINYTHIYLDGGKKITTSKNLKKIEDALTSSNFMRIHNSYIINLKNISKYYKGLVKKVKMKNGSELEISRKKVNELTEKIEAYFPNLF